MKLSLESTTKIVHLMPDGELEGKLINLIQRKSERNEGITLSQQEVETLARLLSNNSIPSRIWQGKTEGGIAVHAFITRLAVDKQDDCSQFERELVEHRPPHDARIEAYALRMVL